MALNEDNPSINQSISGPYLSTLPTELQLFMLRECLTTQTALFNFGSRVTKKHAGRRLPPDATDELFGQDNLSLAILFTCRLYHKAGKSCSVKILFHSTSNL